MSRAWYVLRFIHGIIGDIINRWKVEKDEREQIWNATAEPDEDEDKKAGPVVHDAKYTVL